MTAGSSTSTWVVWSVQFCVHVRAWVYLHVCTFMGVFASVSVHGRICTCVCAWVCLHVCTCDQQVDSSCEQICKSNLYVHTYVCICTWGVCFCPCICRYMHTYTAHTRYTRKPIMYTRKYTNTNPFSQCTTRPGGKACACSWKTKASSSRATALRATSIRSKTCSVTLK